MATYNFSKLSVLVIEDNKFMRALLCSILRAFEFGRILTAENGKDAQGLIGFSASAAEFGGGLSIDVVLSDWMMPQMSGLELLRWVRSHEEDTVRFLPFIMVTGYSERDRVEEARDAGVTEFLAKPLSVQEVAAKLLNVIDRPRPFVRCESYFGPDRRRRNEPFDGTDRRSESEENVSIENEQ